MVGALRAPTEWKAGFASGIQIVSLPMPSPCNILAVGGESKSAVCLLRGDHAILSAPTGSLTDPQSYREFVATIDRFKRRFQFVPDVIAHDGHPMYLSTAYALGTGTPTLAIQHHHAHLAAVAAECQFEAPAIGVCCDGLGFGADGTAWGCEVMRFDLEKYVRCETLDPFPLVGGDASAVQTWRPAASLLKQAFGANWRSQFRRVQGLHSRKPRHPTTEELLTAERLMDRGLALVMTSSLGRLFDGVSFLLGLCEENQTAGQAAIALEHAAIDENVLPYPFVRIDRPDVNLMSVAPMIRTIVHDLSRDVRHGLIASRFHETIARMLATSVVANANRLGLHRVVISGGCFVNRRLRMRLTQELECQGLAVVHPRQIPIGDAGLALGQAVIAASICRSSRCAKLPHHLVRGDIVNVSCSARKTG